MKYVHLFLSIACFAFLFWHVETNLYYQLCQLEHNNLFIGNAYYMGNTLKEVGGVSALISHFGIQFFAFPVWGTVVYLLPLVLTFLCLIPLFRKYNTSWAVPFAALCTLAQLFSQYDFHYYWQGSVSLMLAIGLLSLLLLFKRFPTAQAIAFIIGIPLVGYALGAVAVVYSLGGLILFYDHKRNTLTGTIPFIVWIGSKYMGWCGGFADLLSPAFYYNPLVELPTYHYLGILLPILLMAFARLSALSLLSGRRMQQIGALALWVVLGVAFAKGDKALRDTKTQPFWMLNHFAFTGQWNQILAYASSYKMSNQLYMNYANLALAKTGRLGDDAFRYHPYGVGALLVNGQNVAEVRMLMSDVQYAVGCVAEAQQHAFESLANLPQGYGVQPMMRLVDTNIIYGHWEVAEKYARLIAQSTFRKEWAESRLALIAERPAVLPDKDMQAKREGLTQTNRFAMFEGWVPELEDIIARGAGHHTALTYLGLSYLLNKDLPGFQGFLDRYYGTAGLPQLPIAFQQGVIALFQQQKERWADYNLSPEVVQHYNRYRDTYFQHRTSPNVKNHMARGFSQTFWYYLMFV